MNGMDDAEVRAKALEDAADALDDALDPGSDHWDSSLAGTDFDTDWLRKRARRIRAEQTSEDRNPIPELEG